MSATKTASAKAATVRRQSKKELAQSAAKAAKRLGLAKEELVPLTPAPKAMPSVRSETAETPKVTKETKRSKDANVAKETKVEAPAEETKAVEVTTVERAANCDGWGRRLGTASHFVCRAVVDAGADGASAKDVALAAARLCLAEDVAPRGAIGTQLAHMKEQGLVELEDGKWKATADGLKKWNEAK